MSERVVILKGRTLRGKNRISRGGSRWRIVSERYVDGLGWFLVSEAVGERECMWAQLPNDQHVIEVASRGGDQ